MSDTQRSSGRTATTAPVHLELGTAAELTQYAFSMRRRIYYYGGYTEMAKTTELAPLERKMELIQKVADEANMEVIQHMPKFARGIALAKAMNQLRQLCDGEVMDSVMQLAESPLGFRTDRDGKNSPYPVQVVRDCVIECLLRGGSICGNEMNIISGRCYLTKEYYERMVRELVQDLRIVEGVPQMAQGGGGAYVPMRASWKYEGRSDSIECVKTDDDDTRICVRVNAGMGTDAILGKAYRKLYARIYRRVTGSAWLEEECDAIQHADEPNYEAAIAQQPIDDEVTERFELTGDRQEV